MGDFENEVIAAYRQTLNRPRNLLNVVVYGDFVLTMKDQAFHVVTGGNLLQFLNMSAQRSIKFINIDCSPKSDRLTLRSGQISE